MFTAVRLDNTKTYNGYSRQVTSRQFSQIKLPSPKLFRLLTEKAIFSHAIKPILTDKKYQTPLAVEVKKC
jgi:hypothetical protein